MPNLPPEILPDPITAESWPVSHRRGPLVALSPAADSMPEKPPANAQLPVEFQPSQPDGLPNLGALNVRSHREIPWLPILFVIVLLLLIVRACG